MRGWRPAALISAGLVLVLGVTAAAVFAAKPPPGLPLSVSISPTSVAASSTGNAFAIKVTATSIAAGNFRLTVPAGWTAPQSSNSAMPGYVAILKQTCTSAGPFPTSISGSGPWTLVVAFNCGSNKNFTISYGGSVASSKVTAPSTATSYEFTSEAAIPSSASYARLATQPVVTVTPPAIHFEIAGIPASSSAGSANAFTVTARNASNAIVTTYAGAIHFTSSDAAATLPANYAFSAGDAGSHTFTPGATFRTLGAQSLTATDISNAGITGSTSTNVGPGQATHLVVSEPASATAGSPFGVTVTAKDALNNTATGYTGTVHFSTTDGGSGTVLPANYVFTPGDAGTRTFSNGVTLVTVGSQTVTATDTTTASITGNASTTVSAGAATHFAVSAPASATAGTAFSYAVTAKDAFNNTATGYAGAVHFTSTDGQAVLPANSTLTSGTATFSGTLKTAGNQTIAATDTSNASITGTSGGITVSPGSTTHLAVSAPASASAGVAFTANVTAKDAFNNTATGYSGTVHFTSSDASGTLPADSTLTLGSGSFSVTLGTPGSQTVVATDTTDASITGQGSVVVSAGPAVSFNVTGMADPASPGVATDVTVTARDSIGNVATSYAGTVHLSSTDGAAVLPADYTFTAADNGSHAFGGGVTFNSGGSQSVTATDTADNTITGAQSVAVDDTLYVATTGSDANVGTQAAPLLTVNAAVTKSGSFTGVDNIHVAQGSYNEGVGGVAVSDGIHISGGYAADWTQTGTATTIVGVRESVFADGDTGVVLDHLTLAPIVTANPGSSVYGVRAINGSSVNISNSTITTPAAAAGEPGSAGSNGAPGDNGVPGEPADDNCAAPAGVGGHGGVLFTAGGKGGDTSCSGGAPGAAGSGGGGGGQGAPGGCCDGFDGGTGGAGFQGSFAASGTGGGASIALAGVTWLGPNGTSGGNGGNGSGGGGGGAGGTYDCGFFCSSHPGGGGGGGGGGGQGGQGGGGGSAGGGSFGIYLWASTATVSNTVLTIGKGGSGGAGGLRGSGGPGGSGGFGGGPSTSSAGYGGFGGPGGVGGAGGYGGGGNGGPSIGIFRGSGSTLTNGGGINFSIGGGGSGGPSGGGPGSPGAPGIQLQVL